MRSGEHSNRKRVLIVDDHPITRSGLVYLISRQPDLEVCDEVDNASKAIAMLNACKPDLVLLDIALQDKSGLELIKDITALRPGLPILVISMHDESIYAERALRAGARGYIMERSGGQKLMQAIRRVASGNIYLSERMSGQIVDLLSSGRPARARFPIEQLSDREFEVFELVGTGLSTNEIGAKLHLSAKTVKAHRATLRRKLKMKTTAQLISFAARWIEHEASGK